MSNQCLELLPAYVSPPSAALVLGKHSRYLGSSVNSCPTSKSQLYIYRRSSFFYPSTVVCSARDENDCETPDQSKGPSHQLKTKRASDSQTFEPGAKKTNDFHHSGERTGDQDTSSGSSAGSEAPSFRSVKYPPNFRWPFYQGGSGSQAGSNDDVAKKSKTEKPSNVTDKASNHSDLSSETKPSAKNIFPFPEQTRSIQERWKQVFDKMRPPRSTAKEENNAHGNRKRQKVTTDIHLSEITDEQSSEPGPVTNSGSSVRDLYKPPPSTHQSDSSQKKSSWFVTPWNRTNDSKDSDRDNRSNVDVNSRSSGDMNQETLVSNTSQGKVDSSTGHRWSFPLWKMTKSSHESGPSQKSDSRLDTDENEKSRNESNSSEAGTAYSSGSKTKVCDEEEQETHRLSSTCEHDAESSPQREQDGEERSADSTDDSSSQSSGPDNDVGYDGKSDGTLRSMRAGQNRGTVTGSRDDPDVTFSQQDIANIRLIFGSETFFATEAMSAPGGLIFRGNLRGEPVVALQKLEDRLKSRFGNKYTICLAEGDEDRRPVVVVVPSTHYQRSLSPRQKLIAIGVAAMTATTCLSRGISANMLRQRIFSAYGLPPLKNLMDKLFFHPLSSSVTIACAIAIIVMVSQISQRIVASFYRTRIALPFVLPSYQLGSFGAIVHIASPAPSRTALFDIATAGSATLLIISLVCLLIGLRMSTTFTAVFPVPMSLVSGSIFMGFLTKNVPNGQILVDYGQSLIGLHPLAIIGANCLTIAALNLLPIRLLDGGRIMSALYGRKVGLVVSRMAVLFLLLASSRTPYLVMFLLAVSFGPWYVDRPSKNELTEPNNARTIIGYLLMLTMLGILLPYPKSAFFGTLAS